MIKTVIATERNVEIVDADRVISIGDLGPFFTKKSWSGFPPLSRDIYKWCVKKKCPYRKIYYLPPLIGSIYIDKKLEMSLMFQDKSSCQKFKDHWIQCVVGLDEYFSDYSFASLDGWDPKFSKKAKLWMKENKIYVVEKNYRWIRFRTAAQAMAFKLMWL